MISTIVLCVTPGIANLIFFNIKMLKSPHILSEHEYLLFP